jgi:RecQ family ATP-dependent DNA helicase
MSRLITPREIKNCLREDFGFDSFRSNQSETIDAMVRGKNTFTIMPTGSGKSLIYQLPARLARPNLTVVVSPLISLMHDQVDQAKGVRAVALNSSMDRHSYGRAKDSVIAGKVDLLYVSPEKLVSHALDEIVEYRKVERLVVDEAHCISLWGHNFRPSYRFLSEARKQLGNPPVSLFTATAPPHVKEDVLKLMELEDCKMFQGSIVPDNITFRVNYTFKDDKLNTLESLLKDLVKEEGSIIIYATTIAQVDSLYDKLSHNFDVGKYHSQVDSHFKRRFQEAFMADETKIMVATSAFGMGIDKSDVRSIIHYTLPGSLEQYIQEAGRAGRDGKPAQAIMLYSTDDRKTHTQFIHNQNPPMKVIMEAYKKVKSINDKVTAYQGKPASFAQLLRFFEGAEKEKWFRNRASAAFGMLTDLGLIEVQGDQVRFPYANNITIEEQVLADKKTNDFRRLGMMELYAQSEGSHSSIIENYFLGAGSKLVEATEDIGHTVKEAILGFISKHRDKKVVIGDVLSGDNLEFAEYSEEFRGLPFVSSRYIQAEIDDYLFCGWLKQSRNGSAIHYVLKPEGAGYLLTRGEYPTDLGTLEEAIHDYRYWDDIKIAIKPWIDSHEKPIHALPNKPYQEFINTNFEVEETTYTGMRLLEFYSDNKKPNLSTFKHFMQFYFGMDFTVPDPKKQNGRKFGGFRRR